MSGRILHVINRLGPGGAERQLAGLLERSSLPHDLFELHSAQRGARGRMLGRAGRRVARARPGVVVAWLDRSQIAVAAAAPPGRLRLVASIRGLPRPAGPRQAWILRAALSRYHCTVTNSEASRDAWAAFVPPGRLRRPTVIPNGAALPAGAAEGPRRDGPLRVGFLGRANADKGLDVLLEALRALAPGEVRVRLAGTDVPSAVAAAGLDGVDVVALPAQPDPWEAIGEIDVLAVPSRTEGSPNVVLEAFARGVPVVATAAGGTTELVRDGRGLLVAPEDPQALAAALRQLDRDPAGARRRAAAALSFVGERHAWDAVVARWDELLGAELDAVR